MSEHRLIVRVGGTLRVGSSTEAIIRHVLVHVEAMGAETQMVGGEAINLTLHASDNVSNAPRVGNLVSIESCQCYRHRFSRLSRRYFGSREERARLR
jgi:hypothetical protein